MILRKLRRFVDNLCYQNSIKKKKKFILLFLICLLLWLIYTIVMNTDSVLAKIVEDKDSDDIFIKRNSDKCKIMRAIGFSNKYINISKCKNHSLCKLYKRAPIKKFPSIDGCDDFINCVTVVVKTKKRDTQLVNLIESAWKYYPGLHFSIADDSRVVDTISPQLQKLIQNNDLIKYIELEEHAGISLGRNVALKKAETPYILLMDDDFLFVESSKFDSAFKILISTDISIVGGIVSDCHYSGILKVNLENNSTIIEHIYNVVYSRIPESDDCFNVDIVENFFLAKKKDLLEVGGWTDVLKIAEHEDFFIKLRMAGKNVAFCPKMYVKHADAIDFVRMRRIYEWTAYSKLFSKQWNITSFNKCFIKEKNQLKCKIKD